MTDAETRLIAETFETVERACIPPLGLAAPKTRPAKPWYDVFTVYDLDELHGEVLSVNRELGGYVKLEDHERVVNALVDAEEEIRELTLKLQETA